MKQKSAAILDEGLRQRGTKEFVAFQCTSCWHFMRSLGLNGGCRNCKLTTHIHPIKTRARSQQETEWALEKQRWNHAQREYNPYDPTSQNGRMLTGDQVLKILQKFIPGTQAFMGWNPHYKKPLYNIYVPFRGKEETRQYLSEFQKKNNLQLVCCCEIGLMPEWDIMSRDDQGLPDANKDRQRGWRSVFGTFYRLGLMPFIPDDGRRKSNWEIRESPINKKEHSF